MPTLLLSLRVIQRPGGQPLTRDSALARAASPNFHSSPLSAEIREHSPHQLAGLLDRPKDPQPLRCREPYVVLRATLLPHSSANISAASSVDRAACWASDSQLLFERAAMTSGSSDRT